MFSLSSLALSYCAPLDPSCFPFRLVLRVGAGAGGKGLPRRPYQRVPSNTPMTLIIMRKLPPRSHFHPPPDQMLAGGNVSRSSRRRIEREIREATATRQKSHNPTNSAAIEIMRVCIGLRGQTIDITTEGMPAL